MFTHVSPGLLPVLISGLMVQGIIQEKRERPVKDDLTGKEFGRLKVIREATKVERQHKARGHTYWICQCVCGAQVMIRGNNLKQGNAQSCGCSPRTTHKNNSRKVEMIGKRYGLFTVIREANDEEMIGRKTAEAFWLSRCDCGNERIIRGSNLRYGRSKSCGCARIEELKKTLGQKK